MISQVQRWELMGNVIDAYSNYSSGLLFQLLIDFRISKHVFM